MRNDIPFGLQMAQAIHAGFLFAQMHPTVTNEWMDVSQFLIVVSVPDEDALLAIAQKAADASVGAALWREPDLNDEVTAIALAPGAGARRLCANLPLAGRVTVHEGGAVMAT